jgi:hypothetical protein
LSSVEKAKQAVIQAAAGTIITVGSATGIVVATAIFQKLSVGPVAVVLSDRADDLSRIRMNLSAVGTLPDGLRQQVVHVYLASLVAAVSTFAMKNNPLEAKPVSLKEQGSEAEKSPPKAT